MSGIEFTKEKKQTVASREGGTGSGKAEKG